MKKIEMAVALMLVGFATEAGAQATLWPATAGDAGRYGVVVEQGRWQLAQAGDGQNGGPGMGPGGADASQGGGRPAQGPRRGPPPPEAIDACKGKSSGVVCRFIGRQNQSLTGTCFAPPAGGPDPKEGQAAAGHPANQSGNQGHRPLACRPDRGGPDGGRGPGG